MIWFTWRQFRIQTWITVGGLAVLGVLLAITADNIADAYNAAHIAGCGSNCTGAIDSFLRDVSSGTSGTVYDLVMPTMYILPALIGIFWGAPLIAREIERAPTASPGISRSPAPAGWSPSSASTAGHR
jgi:hypothetical protein